MSTGSSVEAETRQTLVRRFRCVAFAALGAGVPKEDLMAAFEVAEQAQARREAARPHLHVVS